ncbi:MAG: DUF5131 family protein [Bacteroidales bacterium]
MSTKIEWAKSVWNPVTGCSKGCPYCYARSFANRMKHNPNPKISEKYKNGFQPTVHPELFFEPEKWRTPRLVFVASMGDLFDPAFGMDPFWNVMDKMTRFRQHNYILLTKQPERMLNFVNAWLRETEFDTIPDNIWLGVSASDQHEADLRIPLLMQVKAKIRFVSLEPLTGPVSLTKTTAIDRGWLLNLLAPRTTTFIENLDWVILGGMTGNKSTPMHPQWVKNILHECVSAKVPFFFKSWGSWHTACIHSNTGLPAFKMYHNFEQWKNKAWMKHGDKLVSLDGSLPVNGLGMKNATYPVAIMSPLRKGTVCREIDGVEWNQYPCKNL